MSTRINARIDDALAAQLEDLRELNGQTLTELIEAALKAYVRDTAPKKRKTSYEIMKESGYIGCAEGPADLSRNYKQYLRESLERKYGHR